MLTLVPFRPHRTICSQAGSHTMIPTVLHSFAPLYERGGEGSGQGSCPAHGARLAGVQLVAFPHLCLLGLRRLSSGPGSSQGLRMEVRPSPALVHCGQLTSAAGPRLWGQLAKL